MPKKSKHDQVAEAIAAKKRTEYNRGPGADIKTSSQVIEVETPQTIGDASRQLRGHKKPAYVAVTSERAIPKALEHYEGTTIGVMGPEGTIVKRSTRRRS
jgi:hypothetical protein